jgi:hypothetical protein
MDPQPADTDLDLQLVLLPAPVVNTRDKFNSVEGLSGGKFDDKLRGRSDAILLPGTGDLDGRQIDLIPGLQAVLGAGVRTFSDNNDIIMGGAGADLMEGRGSDDIIEGDKWLKFQLRAPNPATADTTDTQLVDSMTTLRADVFAGRIDPGDIKIVRSIETAPAGNDIGTAVFSGPRANYTITPNINRTEMIVTDNIGLDGTDTVRGVERLQFSDVSISFFPTGTLSAPSLTFSAQTTNTTSAAQTGQQPLAITSVAIAGTNPGEFLRPAGAAGGTCTGTTTLNNGQSCTVGVTFRAWAAGTRSATLRLTDNHDNAPGSFQDVALTGTGVLPAPVAGVTPASLTFAARNSGTTSPAQTVTLRNTGNAPLTLSSIALAGTNPGDFARSGGSCPTAAGTLAAGASCTIA